MCTAITFSNTDFYFGRTLDLERSYGEEVVVTPRNYPLPFRSGKTLAHHYAIVGMAHVAQGYPLYYDGINERGLCMAGLHFPEFARYARCRDDGMQVSSFELIPWILGQCSCVSGARELLRDLGLNDRAFSPELPATPLHWILADREDCITVEALAEGLSIRENPVGVLTNSPPFDKQMFHLRRYLQLSPEPPENRFLPRLELRPYSAGMGAMGLPGDPSSQSRFVRAAFMKNHSLCLETECVSQFFHILDTVSLPRGSCRLEDGSCEITRYTCCCNASRGIYHYTTYGNRRITAVDMHREDLEGSRLISYPLLAQEDIRYQNGM